MMSQRPWRMALLAALLLSAAVAGCLDRERRGIPPPPGESPGSSADSPAEGEVTVTMFTNAYDPDAVFVVPGTSVLWENADNTTHTATSLDGDWDTGDVAPGGGGPVVFSEVGDYPYECRYHGDIGMVGTVFVVD